MSLQIESEKILKDHGLRITKTRMAILEQFLTHNAALTHSDIEEKIMDMDRITLYRTLKSFEEKGVIHRAIDGTDKSRYALCESSCTEHAHHHDSHVHFHCNHCEQTFCIDGVSIPTFSTPAGYQVKSSDVVLNGVCPTCSA